MARPLSATIDRDVLVRAAFDQLEEDGLERLSMRRVAARLGVQAAALYWHVRDKAELLGLMAGEIYADAYAQAGEASGWQAWLRGYARALRLSFASHRDGARLCSVARPPLPFGPAGQAARIAAPLTSKGLGEKDALACQATVISFTLGWESFEANGPMRQLLSEIMDFDATFDIGIHALLTGLAQKFGEA